VANFSLAVSLNVPCPSDLAKWKQTIELRQREREREIHLPKREEDNTLDAQNLCKRLSRN